MTNEACVGLVSVSDPMGPVTAEPLPVKDTPVALPVESAEMFRMICVTAPIARSSAGKSCATAPSQGTLVAPEILEIVHDNPNCTGAFAPLVGVNLPRPFTAMLEKLPPVTVSATVSLSVMVPIVVPAGP